MVLEPVLQDLPSPVTLLLQVAQAAGMITALALANPPHMAPQAQAEAVIVHRQAEDAAQVGGILAPVPANRPHQLVVTMCQHQAAAQDGTLIQLPAPAVNLLLHLVELQVVHHLAHVHQVTTGWMAALAGVCLMELAAAVQQEDQLQLPLLLPPPIQLPQPLLPQVHQGELLGEQQILQEGLAAGQPLDQLILQEEPAVEQLQDQLVLVEAVAELHNLPLN